MIIEQIGIVTGVDRPVVSGSMVKAILWVIVGAAGVAIDAYKNKHNQP